MLGISDYLTTDYTDNTDESWKLSVFIRVIRAIRGERKESYSAFFAAAAFLRLSVSVIGHSVESTRALFM